LPGPVFIHAKECIRHDQFDGFPEDLRSHPLTLVAYGEDRTVLRKEYVSGAHAENAAQRLLSDSQVHYFARSRYASRLLRFAYRTESSGNVASPASSLNAHRFARSS
jgi:hypothetical protein